jgi:hypothetical protein
MDVLPIQWLIWASTSDNTINVGERISDENVRRVSFCPLSFDLPLAAVSKVDELRQRLAL